MTVIPEQSKSPESTESSQREGREETADERADRRWNELMQETRVAQTGIQILFGFLLSIAFTPVFAKIGDFDRNVYVVTVLLAAATTGALIAPVAMHRLLSGQRIKPALVTVASRLIMLGIVLLALTLGSALLLLLHQVLDDTTAEWLIAGIMTWFALCWFGIPAFVSHRSSRK